VQRAARQEGIAQLRRAEALSPFDRASITQKLKTMAIHILPKLYDFGFFDLFWIFLALFAPAGVATPPDGIPPCSSPTRIRARAQQPGNFADSPARVDQFTGNSYIALSPEDSEQVLRAIASPHRMSQLT